eukprot:COSAG02_NODE_4591_length_5182_cov_5.857761_1_plen_141_part_00
MKDEIVSVSLAEGPLGAPVSVRRKSASPEDVVEVMTPSGSGDFRASWVPLPPEIPGRLLAGPWPCDKGCTTGDKARVMRALLGPEVGVRPRGILASTKRERERERERERAAPSACLALHLTRQAVRCSAGALLRLTGQSA